ncbi:MAG: selenocysteine-specific translation elongation factor [candidate division WOR-3 bacterium]|nr:MAG: selenocysteine-specific translation elongation factor [candidate division WOR-3 bacterium]
MNAGHVVIGTAGHIDHGKSALVRALTGTDPDRLKEEQERGMTTDLGFAFLGDNATIIDVPGHEKFVRHMLAGASTIDIVMLVVAADDSVMPQTTEHFDICRLMGIRQGLVVVTKTDLVDAEWLELVREDIQGLVAGTFLEGAPVMEVSSVTGQGVPELRDTLDKLIAGVDPKPDRGVFRLPVDRCFTIKGFGTVVAGTVLSGRAAPGDKLELLPQQKTVRVRGIQRHERGIDQTVLGDRAALNLQGIEKETVTRGNVLATPGYYRPTEVFNASLFLLKTAARPLRHMTRVRLHIGTAEVMARVALLGTRELTPGSEGLVQFRTEASVVCDWNDRYVVRSYSPQHTIGGGIVLEPNARKERRFDDAVVARLKAMREGDTATVVEQALVRNRLGAVQPEQLARELALTGEDFTKYVDALSADGKVSRFMFEGKDYLVHGQNMTDGRDAVLAALEEFHRQSPFRVGLKRPELRDKSSRGFSVPLFDAVVNALLADGVVVEEGGRVRRAGHEVRLKPEEQELFDRVGAEMLERGFSPPSLEDALAGARKPLADRVRTALLETGVLVDVGESVVFHRDVVARGRDIVVELFKETNELAASDVRKRMGSTRRYVIPLLNYFDSTGLTQRRGDKRVLRRTAGRTRAAAGEESAAADRNATESNKE